MAHKRFLNDDSSHKRCTFRLEGLKILLLSIERDMSWIKGPTIEKNGP